MKWRAILLAGAMAWGLPGVAGTGRAFAQLVRVHATATVEKGQDVRLGDLATVTGAEGDHHTAELLANTVVLAGVTTTEKVDTDAILLALVSQHGAALTTRLAIEGAATCEVTVTAGGTDIAAATPGTTGVVPGKVPTAELAIGRSEAGAKALSGAAAAIAPPSAPKTLQQTLVAYIANQLGVNPEDLRVTVDSVNPLAMQTPTMGQSWLCRPLAHTLIGMLAVDAQLVDGTKPVARMTVQVHVEKKTPVVIATHMIDRGDVAAKEWLQPGTAWLDRDLPTLAHTPADVVGLEATEPIAAGTRLDRRNFRQMNLVERGQPVTVVFLTGGVRVQVQAEAMESGKLHDTVTVQNGPKAPPYQATLIGRRLAVVGDNVSPAVEAQLRETMR